MKVLNETFTHCLNIKKSDKNFKIELTYTVTFRSYQYHDSISKQASILLYHIKIILIKYKYISHYLQYH